MSNIYAIDHRASVVQARAAISLLRKAADEAYENRQDALCRALNLAAHNVLDALLNEQAAQGGRS